MDENMFHKEAVFLNIDATSTDEVLDYVYHKMHDMGYVTEEFAQAVKDREHKYPTGLPGPICDIAVPHTDPEYVTKPFICLLYTSLCIRIHDGLRHLHRQEKQSLRWERHRRIIFTEIFPVQDL